MKTLAFSLCLALLATAAVAQPAEAPNTLSAAEKADGWKLLFDGKTTNGWRSFKQAQITGPGWKVEDGILSPVDAKASKDIVTKDKYENFELTFEWRISKLGNSGVMFHVLDVGDETYESGPEYQILDNAHGEQPPEQAGGLFALYAPNMDMTRPVGQFNQAKIVVDHGKVQHWLNGMEVAEYDISSPDFKTRVAASKFKRWPQFATGATGYIALQDHGDDVAFRNIKIRPLK